MGHRAAAIHGDLSVRGASRLGLPVVVIVVLLALIVDQWAPCGAWSSEDQNVIEQFQFIGDSHFAFGRALGERFRAKIHARLQANGKLQTRLLPYVETTEDGRVAYDAFLRHHEETFPDYVDELRGLAKGSGVAFSTLFIQNLVEEFDDVVPASFVGQAVADHRRRQRTMHCSDLVLVGRDGLRVVAHNEDGGAADLNHTAIVTAQIGTAPRFVAFTYLGDLPTGAFGVNDRGVAFTLNFVQPSDTERGGLGRGFISRDLLAAVDVADAFRRIGRPRQASGHNYQLMDIAAGRIWNIEAAARNRLASQEILPPTTMAVNVTTFFHANQYQLLRILQPPYASSIHRLARYAELAPPTTVTEALVVLGDQADRLYPIFHDARSHELGELSGWTLTTIVFDLQARMATTYRGNPRLGKRQLQWNLETLNVTRIISDEEVLQEA